MAVDVGDGGGDVDAVVVVAAVVAVEARRECEASRGRRSSVSRASS